MGIINNVTEVLHRIRVKLYPSYLPNVGGSYIARTDNERTLTVEQVCAALKNRGGFTGRYDEVVDSVREFFDEAAYQLCDGYAVNVGYFSIHPNVGGTFNSAADIHDHQKHPITFRFRSLAPLRKLAGNIAVEIEGVADTTGYIDEFLDISTGTINETITPGRQFVIHGHKIKVAGDDPSCGVYFQCGDDTSDRINIDEALAENSPSKVIGITPALAADSYKVVIVTQYSGTSSTPLKSPRTLIGSFEVSVQPL